MTAFPIIFHYSDYRLFLKDYLKTLKDKDKKYSQRYIIMKIGESSAGWISDVIAGRKNINETQMFKLCQILDLDPRSEIFFELLVKFSQAGTHEERTRIYDKLRTFQECPSEILDVDRFDYFNKWYHAAIRELLLLKDFQGNFKILAASLCPSISEDEAKKSIELLVKLNMVSKKVGGNYTASTPHVSKKKTFNSLHYRNYLQTNINLAMESMERFDNTVRDVSAINAVLTDEQFAEIREDIKSVRKKIIRLSEAATDEILREKQESYHIYQGVFGLFPLTKHGSEMQ